MCFTLLIAASLFLTFACERGESAVVCQPGTYHNYTNASECLNCSAGTYNYLADSKFIMQQRFRGIYYTNVGPYYLGNEGFGPSSKETPGMVQNSQGVFVFRDPPWSTTYTNINVCCYTDGLLAKCTEVSFCLFCKYGYFQSIPGSTSCGEKCPFGTYTPGYQPGAACVACPWANMCCRRGEYYNSSACTLCAVGTHGPLVNASSCSECPAGQYNTAVGLTSCLSCGAGKYSISGGLSTCLSCATGYGSPVGGSICLMCAPGSYAKVSSDCVLCAAGTYSNAGGSTFCQGCAAGLGSAANSTACVACSPGYYSTGGAACSTCLPGKYTAVEGQTACLGCSAGYGSSAASSTGCVACDVGYFSVGNSSCLRCPTGYTSDAAGLSACSFCASGYVSSGQLLLLCLACPGGTYSNSAASLSTACADCAYGEYSSNATASTACVECALCETGFYRSDCGGASKGSCVLCSNTPM